MFESTPNLKRAIRLEVKRQLIKDRASEQKKPLCPDCGRTNVKRRQSGTMSPSGFRGKVWYQCPDCGWRSKDRTNPERARRDVKWVTESTVRRRTESIGGEAGQLKGELNRLNTKLIAFMGRVNRYFNPPRQVPYVQAMKQATDHVHQAFMILKELEAELDSAERG